MSINETEKKVEPPILILHFHLSISEIFSTIKSDKDPQNYLSDLVKCVGFMHTTNSVAVCV